MSMNLAEEGMDGYVVRKIKDLEAQLRDLKTKQLIGGENTVVQGSSLASSSDLFNPGQYHDYTVTFTPNDQILGIPQLTMSFFIDNDLAPDYEWPIGASLNNDQRSMERWWHLDWFRSVDATGVRKWTVRIYNPSGTAFTVYSKFKIYTIKNPAAIS
jgi:hypothetical protein